MRDSTTISLPEGMLATLKEYISKRGFSSLSEYLLYAVQKEQELLTEDDILDHAKQVQKDYEEGNYVVGVEDHKKHMAKLRKELEGSNSSK